jgi:hypothetical protein
MAETRYVTKNRLTAEAAAAQKRARWVVLILGLPVVAACTVVAPPLGGVAFVVVAIVYFTRTRDEIISAGAAGEDIALKALRNLPDSYVIFNQVDVPNQRSRTGLNEIDVLVCGPGAIFAIEVKHNNGLVQCDESSPDWIVTKTGRGGSLYEKGMRNPIAQIKKLVWLLSEYLKQHQAKPWIQGLVVFTNPDVQLLGAGPLSLPVLRTNELVSYIQNFTAGPKSAVMEKATHEIARLKGLLDSAQQGVAADGPRAARASRR